MVPPPVDQGNSVKSLAEQNKQDREQHPKSKSLATVASNMPSAFSNEFRTNTKRMRLFYILLLSTSSSFRAASQCLFGSQPLAHSCKSLKKSGHKI